MSFAIPSMITNNNRNMVPFLVDTNTYKVTHDQRAEVLKAGDYENVSPLSLS